MRRQDMAGLVASGVLVACGPTSPQNRGEPHDIVQEQQIVRDQHAEFMDAFTARDTTRMSRMLTAGAMFLIPGLSRSGRHSGPSRRATGPADALLASECGEAVHSVRQIVTFGGGNYGRSCGLSQKV